jgi:Cu-Zn family superoxide dismutase
VAALIILAAGCGTPAPESGSPHTSASSAITVYTLAESGEGQPGQISHGKPMDIDWDAPSSSFLVSTYNDGTIYRGRLNDPNVPVYIEGTLGQTAEGITVTGGLLYVTGGISGQIRVYNLVTKAQVGRFDTGTGGELVDLVVTDTGDVWATDGVRPVLWHLTPQQVAAGSGTPTALPVAPEVPYSPSNSNLTGLVAMTNQRLVVVSEGDGTLYRIDLDSHAPRGRTITQISGATVHQGESMLLDGHRLVVADFHGLSIINLRDDAQHATAATTIRDPAFHETFSAARVADRYLTVSSATEDGRPPYTVLSVPAPS